MNIFKKLIPLLVANRVRVTTFAKELLNRKKAKPPRAK
jgi:hypothetical protein